MTIVMEPSITITITLSELAEIFKDWPLTEEPRGTDAEYGDACARYVFEQKGVVFTEGE